MTSQIDRQVEWTNRHIWLSGCDIETEYRQAVDEGREMSSLESEFKRLRETPRDEKGGWGPCLTGKRDWNWHQDVMRLMDAVQRTPFRKDYPYQEPSDLEGIKAARGKAPALKVWKSGDKEFLRQLHGGLLGRICGCMLGKPVEGWMREKMRINAEESGNFPLNNYWRKPNDKEAAAIKARGGNDIRQRQKETTLPDIDGMVEDDDINYTTTGFAVLKRHGKNFTPADVATFWCNDIPILHTCTAERVAYRNFCNIVPPPESAVVRNPYREWIGAQIRADYFGFANPGSPERAAEWAWRDACISHIRNGIYGEMWVAACLAAAYVENDWTAVLRAGLAQIPERSRLQEDIEKIIALHAKKAGYEDAVAAVHAQWDEKVGHHWCHTNSNAQLVAVGMLWGEDDFEKTITRAVMPGFDTDCNGATAGGLWGVRHGVDALPKKWTEPMQDRVRTGVSGYSDTSISKLAAEMVEVAVKNRE